MSKCIRDVEEKKKLGDAIGLLKRLKNGLLKRLKWYIKMENKE